MKAMDMELGTCWRTILSLLCVVSLVACTSTPGIQFVAVDDELLAIDSDKCQRVTSLVEDNANARVLLVFDIDNAVLESSTGQFLGSAQWDN